MNANDAEVRLLRLRGLKTPGLREKLLGFAEGVCQLGEEHCSPGTIGDAVIARDGQRHYGANGWFAIDGNDAIGDAADGENCRLGWSDDRAEVVDLIHAEVADRECGIGDVGGVQLASASALGNIATLDGDLGQARSVSIWDDGGNDSVIYCNRYAHVDVIVEANALARPTGVQPGMFEQNAGNQRHQQVCMRDADLLRALDFSDDAVAIGVEGGGVDVAADKEMRDGRPALRGALGHDAAE